MQSNTLPIVNAGLDQEICIYGGGAKLETVVNSTALISNIEWSPNNSLIGYNSQNPTANPLQSTLYIAKVTDENGCVGVDSVMVNVKSFEECYNIIIPPIFTPNGDGYNDYWVIEGMDQFPQSKIQIFDRFGQLMHVYLKSEGDWNGYSFGKLVASDSYWYVVDVVPVGVTLKGHVSVKR